MATNSRVMYLIFRLCLVGTALSLLYAILYFHFSPDLINTLIFNAQSEEEELFSTCKLIEFEPDGWTNDVLLDAEVDYNPLKKCNHNFKPYTVLGDNGSLWIHEDFKDDGIRCWSRGIYFDGDFYVKLGGWTELKTEASNSMYDTDFVNTNCENAKTRETILDYIHTQIVVKDEEPNEEQSKESAENSTKPEVPEPSSDDEKPSVYIFLLDSVSNTQAWRSLPKTIALLKREFEAVNFRHLNKVGENSRPNGLAMFFGKLITPIDKSIFHRPYEQVDWNNNKSCDHYIDDSGFILSEYTKKGYKSLMAEDWAYGVFNYPDCWGFGKKPVTHYMRPFQIYYELDLAQSVKYMNTANCMEYHHFLYKYTDQFMQQYPNVSKIALVWASELAHNYNDNLFHADGYFFNTFLNWKEELDKSYVFFLGDHGIRWGKVRETPIGKREINNPMLYMSVPRKLRKDLLPAMKANSEQLLTSFDIHATLVDILNDPKMLHNPQLSELRGDSLIRPLPPTERSCRSLPIPLQFCLCEWNRTDVGDKKLMKDVGEGTVKAMNKKLKDNGLGKMCEKHKLIEVSSMGHIEKTNGIYEIYYKTAPCDGEYSMVVRGVRGLDGKMAVEMAANDFYRQNSYGDQANCVHGTGKSELRPLCCCKNRNETSAEEE